MAIRISPKERERSLVDATERYMRGSLTRQDFEEEERKYMPDYAAAADALAKARRPSGPLLYRLLTYLRSLLLYA